MSKLNNTAFAVASAMALSGCTPATTPASNEQPATYSDVVKAGDYRQCLQQIPGAQVTALNVGDNSPSATQRNAGMTSAPSQGNATLSLSTPEWKSQFTGGNAAVSVNFVNEQVSGLNTKPLRDGTTVTFQRGEDIWAQSDRVFVSQNGRVIAAGTAPLLHVRGQKEAAGPTKWDAGSPAYSPTAAATTGLLREISSDLTACLNSVFMRRYDAAERAKGLNTAQKQFNGITPTAG